MSCIHRYLQMSLQLSDDYGEYDGNNLKGGERMVQIEKDNVGGTPYLNKKIVNDKGVKKVKIIEEPRPVEVEFEGKKSTRIEAVCSTQVSDPKQVRWQMNPTTKNYMIDKYGADTKSWINQEIDVVVKQAGSASPGVYPRDCSLEKVIA